MGRPISLYTDATAKHQRIHSNPRAGRETADQTSRLKLVAKPNMNPKSLFLRRNMT
jgi:hypothetical protein